MLLRAAVVTLTLVTTIAPATAEIRTDGWHRDLDIVRDQWLTKDRSFAPAARAQAERRLADLRARVATTPDSMVTAELARIAALSANAHTRAYLLRNRGYWRRYPIRIWKFADGWRVVAAQGPGERLLGRKVVAVGGVPVDKVQAAVRPLFAGNDQWADYMASYSLTSPEALAGTGALASPGAAAFTVKDERGRATLMLEPLPHQPRDKPEESWWFLSPAHPASTGWRHVLNGRTLPPVLAGAARNYAFRRCQGNIAYFQFNRAQDDAGESLAAFGERMLAELKARPARQLIVDLRFNTGGDLTKGHGLFKAITAEPWSHVPGQVSAVIGPNTFSAGITHAVWLKQESAATFVGTEPGDVLDTWAEGGNIDLPYSKLRMHYADMAHRYSKRPVDVPKEQVYLDWNVDDLKPRVAADWTWASYYGGRDPYTEALLQRPLRC